MEGSGVADLEEEELLGAGEDEWIDEGEGDLLPRLGASSIRVGDGRDSSSEEESNTFSEDLYPRSLILLSLPSN